jgi:hypothetical protein
MPTPREGETRQKFIQRCIPQVIRDGTAEDGTQGAAVCQSIWRQNKRGEATAEEAKEE